MIDGGWKYAAASIIGTSHQSSEAGICQDSHACHYIEAAEAFVAVVSDGAGSASHSQIGSQSTCQYIIARTSTASPEVLLTPDFASDVLDGLREHLQTLADVAELKIRAFACTMLVAIVFQSRAVFWQIGDGAICFRVRDEETVNYAFWPEKGDYANVTFFVTDVSAHEHLDFDAPECEIVELAIFSDGLERLALDFVSGEAHAGFFNALFPHLRPLQPGYSTRIASDIAGFLSSERVNTRTDDDKTLVLASRVA